MTPQPFYTLQRRSFNESRLMFGFVPEPGRGRLHAGARSTRHLARPRHRRGVRPSIDPSGRCHPFAPWPKFDGRADPGGQVRNRARSDQNDFGTMEGHEFRWRRRGLPCAHNRESSSVPGAPGAGRTRWCQLHRSQAACNGRATPRPQTTVAANVTNLSIRSRVP
jgi:hypothetical protein